MKIISFTIVLLFLGAPFSHGQPLTCTRVVGGDIIILNNGEKVRLLGVDTSEIKQSNKPAESFAKEAAAFTKKLVEGKAVRLEYDLQKRDQYGMLLAYVYLWDGTLLYGVYPFRLFLPLGWSVWDHTWV